MHSQFYRTWTFAVCVSLSHSLCFFCRTFLCLSHLETLCLYLFLSCFVSLFVSHSVCLSFSLILYVSLSLHPSVSLCLSHRHWLTREILWKRVIVIAFILYNVIYEPWTIKELSLLRDLLLARTAKNPFTFIGFVYEINFSVIIYFLMDFNKATSVYSSVADNNLFYIASNKGLRCWVIHSLDTVGMSHTYSQSSTFSLFVHWICHTQVFAP